MATSWRENAFISSTEKHGPSASVVDGMDVERQETTLSSFQGHTGLTTDNSDEEEDGAPLQDGVAEQTKPCKHRKKTKIIWYVHAQGMGWAEAMLILLTIARQECHGPKQVAV